MLLCKSLRAFRHKIHMRALAQHLARSADGIGNVLHASHASGAESGAVHDEGIELHLAFAIQKAAAPGVEGLVVFHDDNRFFGGVER